MADTETVTEQQSTRLQVAAARQEESGQGIARMPRSAFQALGVTEGDIVEITGKRMTAAIAMPSYDEDQALSVVRLDGLQRGNAETASGEHVTIKRAVSRPATRVVFAPAQREMRIQGPSQALKRNFFGKPLVAGDLVATAGQQPVQNMPPEVRRMFNAPAYALTQIRLNVVSTTPKGIVHIDENTEVEMRAEFEEPRDGRGTVNYDDVGGMPDTIQALREMVELPLRYPELFTRLGVDPPKGVLLHGPPGTGKTRLAQAVANESDAEFFTINGPEIVGSGYGESEKRLREVFEAASKAAPAIIFIDEIDSIAPKRAQVTGETEKRLVAQLLTLMDGLESRSNLVVIAATNRPDAIDEALRRPGRFDREIVIGVPDEKGRREILAIHTRGMPLGDKVDLDELARTTHGFVGADIAALAREAAIDAVRRIMPRLDLDERTIPPEVLEDLHVSREDFLSALKRVQP
ncbi:MAG: AAA family ATPase, partial [Sphingomonadaceae bacterium]